MKLKTFLMLILLTFSISFSMEIPYFSLKDENGKTITREDLKGKPSVLIFWGLNCGSCEKELPIFNKFYEKYKDKINFYAIVIDTNDVKEVKERKYLWGFDIPVLLNGRNIMYKYRIFGVPITYLVDKNLKKKKILIGRVSEERIKKEINNLLQD